MLPNFFRQHIGALITTYASTLLVAAWFLLKRLPEWIRSWRAESWPIAQGRIETVNVTTFREPALAELGYSYVIREERFAGYYALQFADEQHAWDYVDGLQGQQVAVRYKENDPSVSALRTEDQQSYVKIEGQSFVTSFFRAIFERIAEFYPRRL